MFRRLTNMLGPLRSAGPLPPSTKGLAAGLRLISKPMIALAAIARLEHVRSPPRAISVIDEEFV